MQEYRCPECGYRLTSSECPICQKRVPFPAGAEKAGTKPAARQVKTESTTRKAAYVPPQKQTYIPPQPQTYHAPRQTGSKRKNSGCVVALVVVLAMFILNFVLGLFYALSEPDIFEDDYYDYYYETVEAYQEAGAEGAEDVPTIDPVEIYNDNDIRISVDSFGLYYSDEYALSVTITNDSDRNVTVCSDALSVNDYMLISSGLFYQVESGETVEAYLKLYADELEDAGIDTVANVTFLLDIYDSDDYTDIGQTELVVLDTSVEDDYVQPVDDSGREVYNDGSIRIVYKGVEIDDFDDCTVTFFMENLSEEWLVVTDDGITVNGDETSSMLWGSLRPGTRTVDNINIYSISELGITDVSQLEEMTIDLMIREMESWDDRGTLDEPLVIDLTAG